MTERVRLWVHTTSTRRMGVGWSVMSVAAQLGVLGHLLQERQQVRVPPVLVRGDQRVERALADLERGVLVHFRGHAGGAATRASNLMLSGVG